MEDDYETYLRHTGTNIRIKMNQAIMDGLYLPTDVRQEIENISHRVESAANCIRQLKEVKR